MNLAISFAVLLGVIMLAQWMSRGEGDPRDVDGQGDELGRPDGPYDWAKE